MRYKGQKSNAHYHWTCLQRKINKIFDPSTPHSHLKTDISMQDTLYLESLSPKINFSPFSICVEFFKGWNTWLLHLGLQFFSMLNSNFNLFKSQINFSPFSIYAEFVWLKYMISLSGFAIFVNAYFFVNAYDYITIFLGGFIYIIHLQFSGPF